MLKNAFKIVDLDPDVDDFQNVIRPSLTTDTSGVKFCSVQ